MSQQAVNAMDDYDRIQKDNLAWLQDIADNLRELHAQIRAAYRLLAKQHHPDLNAGSPAAGAHTQALNAAHEILSDPEKRAAFDRELDAPKKSAPKTQPATIQLSCWRIFPM